jgi:hypothetical protein
MTSAGVILLLCALACPVRMGLMMLFMRKGHGHSAHGEGSGTGEDRSDERAD